MANNNPNTSGLIPWQPGQSGNPKGMRKGTKNLATIIREFEDEEFDWENLPFKLNAKNEKIFKELGAPFRAVVYVALFQSLQGNQPAREWLRKAGYGDQVDVTTKGEKIEAPLIISTIPPRHVETEDETTDSS